MFIFRYGGVRGSQICSLFVDAINIWHLRLSDQCFTFSWASPHKLIASRLKKKLITISLKILLVNGLVLNLNAIYALILNKDMKLYSYELGFDPFDSEKVLYFMLCFILLIWKLLTFCLSINKDDYILILYHYIPQNLELYLNSIRRYQTDSTSAMEKNWATHINWKFW